MPRDQYPPNGDGVVHSHVYGKLPNAVIRDEKLSLAAKIIAANRSTYVGPYRTWEVKQRSLVRSGLGKNVARAAIAELRLWGFFGVEHRDWALMWRCRMVGRIGDRPEVVAVPDADYTIVRRDWFGGQFTLNEVGALLYITSGLPGPTVFLEEVARFLRVSKKTAGAYVERLVEAGYVEVVERSSDGRFAAKRFRAINDKSRFFPGVVVSGGSNQGDLLKTLSDAGLQKITEVHTNEVDTADAAAGLVEKQFPSALCDNETPFHSGHEPAELDLWEDHRLLGWLDDTKDELAEKVADFYDTHQDTVDEVADAILMSELRRYVEIATGGRVSHVVVSDEGLWVVRWTAAYLMERVDEELTAAEALAEVLNAIAERILRKPHAHLNSWRLIVERILWEVYRTYCVRIFAEKGPRLFVTSDDGEQLLINEECLHDD